MKNKLFFGYKLYLSAQFAETEKKSLLLSRKEKRNFSYERYLDLHGLTQDEAFVALSNFLKNCRECGHSKVLVITGGNVMRNSVLRRNFPEWMHILSEHIVKYDQANLKHGGQGAFYVILKKK